jgi:penicillin amidase
MASLHEASYGVAGLNAEAEIRVDRWGVPHIRAQSRDDAFLLQGFNAARDRLWQLDLWRKRGLGLLAGDFGPGYLAQDRAARLFLYRGDMAAEWAAYGVPGMRGIAERFVAGINAWIALCESRPDLQAPEFAAMGTRAQRWAPEDVVRIRSHALVRNLPSEAMRARVLTKADLEIDRVRRSIDPPHDIVMPDGFDPADFPEGTLDVFQLATAPVTFSPERLAAKLSEAGLWSKVTDLGEVYAAAPEEGSNNWVVAPARTATGRPVLATDPHRVYLMPSIRYVVHLTAPGLDVIGAGEPVVPGISHGHNGRCAFGMTIFPADQEDLYVYQTDPADPGRYRYGTGFDAFKLVRELIPVRGEKDQEVELRFTRHGPVIRSDAKRNRAIAVRTVWQEPGTAAYLAGLACMEATTQAEFAASLRGWGAPTSNYVAADTHGDIGWFVCGMVPRRAGWDGLLPVPGDGRYEWNGFTDPADLPQRINPDRGFVATANEMNMPADYPAEQMKLGFEFSETSRSRRIHEVLDGDGRHSVAAACALQTDDMSLPARRILEILSKAKVAEGEAARLLGGWDGRLHESSAAAALFEVWWTLHLKPGLLACAAPDPALRRLLVPGDHETLLGALEQPARFRWLANEAKRDTVLRETLAAAWKACIARLGTDPSTWSWGRLHHGYFAHPLPPTVREGTPLRDVGPLPKGGSGSTPMNAGYRPADFRAISGASFRAVFDVGAWDNSVFINTPGQSGDPRSPHYDDLATLWAARQFRPLLYSRAAVDEATETIIRLLPK